VAVVFVRALRQSLKYNPYRPLSTPKIAASSIQPHSMLPSVRIWPFGFHDAIMLSRFMDGSPASNVPFVNWLMYFTTASCKFC
jgi:hypothetical protein